MTVSILRKARILKTAFAIAALLIGCTGGFAQAQQQSYRRVVVDAGARPLNWFNVTLHTLPDSTYVGGETCVNGRMELPASLATGRKLVRISSLGYEDFAYAEEFAAPASAATSTASATSAPDTIVMRNAVVAMDAVTVTARMPVVTTDRGKTVVRVAGSSLQHLPDVQDILRRAPGMQVNDGGITIFGKGAPQIFLDGRESTYAELQLLQPSQILSIEIDRNPSARYDAEYSSVVRVRTTRRREGVSGQVANHAYQGRRFSDYVSGQLQIAREKWVNYFSYQYSDSRSRNYAWDTEAIHLPSNPLVDSIYTDAISATRSHSLLYGSTLDVGARHRLSWQYRGSFSRSNTDNRGEERIFRPDGLQRIEADDLLNRRGQSHSANVGYRFAVDSVRTLDVTADWARSAPRSTETVLRHYKESGKQDRVTIGNRSAADVFSAKAEYTTPLWGAELLAGARYGRIDSRTTTDYNEQSTTTLLKSDNAALYTTLGDEYAKWGWQAGLRGEFLNDDIRVGGQTLRNGWQNNLFPSLEFHTSELSKALDLALSYTSRISRPSVSQLNPSANYINSVVTGYGNPLLLSTVSHIVEMGVTLWSNLSLNFGAGVELNPSIDAGELSEDGQSIAFKPLNVARSRSFLVDATYNNSWGRFSLTLNGGVVFPHARIPYLGETISVGRPSWYASVNADLSLGKSTYLTGGFDYYGRGYALMTVMEPANNLTFGVTQYTFDRRLQLSLTGYDLLRGGVGSGGNGWRDRYGFYETSQRTGSDSRMVRLSVRWSFNNYKARYNARGSSAEQNRVN